MPSSHHTFGRHFSLPPDLTDCNPSFSVMAQMPPLIITQSLSLFTECLFFHLTSVVKDIRGHSKCILAPMFLL